MMEIFDSWPDKYDLWFETPLGRLIKGYESDLVMRMLEPAAGNKGHSLFRHAVFRSPEEMKGLAPVECTVETAIHFNKNDDPDMAPKIEKAGMERGLNTGAFIAARWTKN
jgi:hypothetical protein